jgi:hypothetical protein
MPILADFGCNEQGYIDQEKHHDSPRPGICPGCGEKNCLVGHGYYQRKAQDDQRVYFIRVKRWLCKVCHHSLSVLPNFLFPWRHYLVRVIQTVVAACFEHRLNWKQVEERSACRGTPALRTLQRWCKAFAGHAPAWLDPQGEAPQAENAAVALLSASLHLLAWSKTAWSPLVGYGLNDRLRFLGLWGAERGLGRLV